MVNVLLGHKPHWSILLILTIFTGWMITHVTILQGHNYNNTQLHMTLAVLGMVKGALGVVKGALGMVKGALGMVKGALGVVKGALGVVKGAWYM